MTTRPDFSPAMLRGFLAIRIGAVACDHERPPARPCERCRRDYQNNLRKHARVTWAQFNLAKAGRLHSAAPRAALWRAMGISPADGGIRLLDGGGQEAVG